MARPSRRASELGFEAISVEGALITPEQIAEIVKAGRNQKIAAEYDCPKGTDIGDEIARYFRIGQAHWQQFARIEAPSIRQVAEFARDLLVQVFGFSDLVGPVEHRDGSRRYRIAWEAKGGRVPIICAAPVPDGDGFARASPEFGDGDGGRARRSPMVLLQDWLNASTEASWGLVFAGDRVRLMRDNASLTRAAWIEADLAAIFRDEMFADFTALWLLIHASRFGPAGASPSALPLENWREAGQKQGTAARERLREGVEAALRELGQGLVSANPEVRARIESGTLSLDAVFEELLRTVYRLIFLAVAEDRDLLHPPTAPRKTRDLYADSYSFGFWRERSARRTAYDAHHDAWEGMKVTLAALENGEPQLGLPALAGLFGGGQTPTMRATRIPNRNFLMAIYRLGFLQVESTRTRINWRDMKTEELGSVYESLLEIRPILRPNGDFELDSGARGNARKTSGSYYTPDRLVETLLDSALNPVLEHAEANGGADAILDLRIIDPACGSGHFLLGAARRMADRVAELRNPDAPDRQAALREVVGRCIHGVDRNPMAVELAKVALWIESVTPGQPLGFLDASIRCGDALLGIFDLKVLEYGIPDDAYKPLTGDDKATASGLKRTNRAERDAPLLRHAIAPEKLVQAFDRFHDMPEGSVTEVRAKASAYRDLRNSQDWQHLTAASNAYIAAFLLPKPKLPDATTRPLVPTTRHVREALDRRPSQGQLADAIDGAAISARVLHWPIEFPDVMIGRGGFDVVLGNPPWERVKLQEQEFFAGTAIADEPNAAARTRAIARLAGAEPGSRERLLFEAFETAKRTAEATSVFARVSGNEGGRYRYTGTGDVNTYALFAEHFLNVMQKGGQAGVIVPTGIATDATTAPFFAHLVETKRLARLVDFENSQPLFPGVHRSFKFCLLTLGSAIAEAEFAFFLTDPMQLEDERRRFSLSPAEIARINPNTKTAPVFRARFDAELTAGIYNRVPVLIAPEKGATGNPWRAAFHSRIWHMAEDSNWFRTADQLAKLGYRQCGTDWMREESEELHQSARILEGDDNGLQLDVPMAGVSIERYAPLYEAKMVHQFDHRWATYAFCDVGSGSGFDSRDATLAEKQNPLFEVTPRYWVPEREIDERLRVRQWNRGWLLGWRNVCRSTDERTVIAAAVPRTAVGHSMPLVFIDGNHAAFLANWLSLPFDFVARQKLAGINLTFAYLNQFPVFPPSAYSTSDLNFIAPRVLELTYTSQSMAPFARDLGYDGPPFVWDEDRRAELRADLDAWYALAYGLSRDELRYVLDPKDVMGEDYPSETFRVLQKNEIARYGEYRTRRLVLAAYDRFVAAAPVTDTVSDGAWQHQLSGEIDMRHLLAGLLKRMRGPKPVREVVYAMLFAARPHLLMQHLDTRRKAEWRRLVGPDADLPTCTAVVGIASGHLGTFAQAKARLAAERALRFDASTQTWDRGAPIYDYTLPAWCEGRADFVWHAMRTITLDSVQNALPQEERDFIGFALAA